jgi:hypothetical protein
VLIAAPLLTTLPAGEAAGALKLAGPGGKSLRGPFESWTRAAHVPLPEGTVVVGLRGCPGRPDLAGCVITRHPRRIYLRSDSRHTWSVFLHELGHVFDLTVMGRSDRRRFLRIHGRAGRWWRGPSPPAEWFAEAYSLCARFGARLPARLSTTYRYRPGAWRHRASCRVIRAAAAQPRIRLRKGQPPNVPPTLIESTQPAPAPAPAPAPGPPPPQRCLLILCG